MAYSKVTQARTSIKNLPQAERPREKIISGGIASLTNAELLAVLIGSGNKEASVMTLAERVLAADSTGLLYLNDCSYEELCQIEGIGPAKSAIILAAVELGRRLMTAPRKRKVSITRSDEIAALYMEKMRYLKKENLKVLLLNAKNEIMMTEDVSTGSLMTSEAHPREVFSAPIKRGAANIILVHNHPSGDPSPSEADILLTERLSEAGMLLGINVLDHIIIGDGIYTSLKSEGAF